MATHDQKKAADLGEQAIALAEQLGRIAGTIEGTAESWMNRQKLTEQLARVRDGAAQMLESLADGVARGRGAMRGVQQKKKAAPAPSRTPQPDPARAPGKRRRKPGPSIKGVKKSDLRIPKLKTAEAARRRRKTFA